MFSGYTKAYENTLAINTEIVPSTSRPSSSSTGSVTSTQSNVGTSTFDDENEGSASSVTGEFTSSTTALFTFEATGPTTVASTEGPTTEECLSDEKCPRGLVYCLEQGICSHDCEGNDDEDADNDFIHCPNGEIYCLDTGFCARECGDFQDDKEDIIDECPKGTIFCLDLGICSEKCHDKRDANFNPKSLWRHQKVGRNTDGCRGNTEYCPEIDACVENCDAFKNHFIAVCKEGYVSIRPDLYAFCHFQVGHVFP